MICGFWKGRFSGEGQVRPIDAGPSAYLGYWKLTGGQKPAEEIFASEAVTDIVQKVEEGLHDLIAEFQKEDTPFLCIPDPSNAPRFNDYEHLARLKEWAALDETPQEAA